MSIKYFRLPPVIIREICKTAHSRGIPVTAHLETTEAMEAIEAGVDGIEHITSLDYPCNQKEKGENTGNWCWPTIMPESRDGMMFGKT